MHLETSALTKTIKDKNETSSQDRAKAWIVLHHHLDEGLEYEYMNIKKPHIF